MICNYEAWSEDVKYGLRIPSQVLKKMLNFCREVEDIESGGVMVGYYNREHDCAIVIDCSGPPKDSKRGKSFFHRGIHGLQRWIDKLWKLRKRRYYLGEWHFHPFANPNPSVIDIKQMKTNADNELYKCPEPLMIIMGGNPHKDIIYRSFVYDRKKGLIELFQQWEKQK